MTRTEIRCFECGAFFLKTLRACPACHTPIRGVNAGMLGQRWANALNAQKRHAIEET